MKSEVKKFSLERKIPKILIHISRRTLKSKRKTSFSRRFVQNRITRVSQIVLHYTNSRTQKTILTKNCRKNIQSCRIYYEKFNDFYYVFFKQNMLNVFL